MITYYYFDGTVDTTDTTTFKYNKRGYLSQSTEKYIEYSGNGNYDERTTVTDYTYKGKKLVKDSSADSYGETIVNTYNAKGNAVSHKESRDNGKVTTAVSYSYNKKGYLSKIKRSYHENDREEKFYENNTGVLSYKYYKGKYPKQITMKHTMEASDDGYSATYKKVYSGFKKIKASQVSDDLYSYISDWVEF